jgi:hypothetical protein
LNSARLLDCQLALLLRVHDAEQLLGHAERAEDRDAIRPRVVVVIGVPGVPIEK